MNPLLRWAIENMPPLAPEAEGSEAPKREVQPIDRKWMDILLKPDADKMKEALAIYHDGSRPVSDRAAALDDVEFYTESIDNASDLNHPSIDGLRPMLDGLQGPEPELRLRCASILGTCMQNNPKVQQQVSELGGAQKLVDALKHEPSLSPPRWDVLGKLAYATGALLGGGNVRGQKEFYTAGGFPLLLDLLRRAPTPAPTTVSQPSEGSKAPADETGASEAETSSRPESDHDRWLRLARKILFVLDQLMQQGEHFKLYFGRPDSGLVDSVLPLLDEQNDVDLHEKALSLLATLAKSDNPTTQQHVVESLRAQPTLRASLERFRGSPAGRAIDATHLDDLLSRLS